MVNVIRVDTNNKRGSAFLPLKCQIVYLSSFLAIVVVNLISYSTITREFSNPIRAERKNTTSREEVTHDVQSFLLSTLSSHLVESFSNDSELSSLYTLDSPIFLNTTTPQGKAFDWLLSFDDFKDSKSKWIDPADNPTILQRYILAVLFFATEGEYNDKLGRMFTPTNNKVGSWTAYGTLNFLSSSHECSWKHKNIHGSLKGVKSCNPSTQEITELIIPEASLHGELPEEIGYLSNLVTLDLQNNFLGGTIPTSIGRMTSLKTLGKASLLKMSRYWLQRKCSSSC